MRYYDLIETPKTGKTFLEEGTNRLPQDNPLVEIYFKSIDKIKFDRGFDRNGYPILLEYELDEDGNRYEFYQEFTTNGVFLKDNAKIAKKALSITRSNFISIIESHVQEQVAKYNLENNVMFKDVHNCATYKDVATYPHQSFCQAIVAFNADTWEVGRLLEAEVLAGTRPMPTEEELKAELPVFGV